MEKKPNLLKKLESVAPIEDKSEVLKKEPCTFEKNKCTKCLNYGVSIIGNGIQAYAELCECVVNCSQCLGTAYNVSSGTAVSCKTTNPRIVINLFNQASIPLRYKSSRLETFRNDTDNNKAIVRALERWLESIKNKEEPKGIIFEGGVGRGKTYLLTAMAKRVTYLGYSAKFVDFFQLVTELKVRYATREFEKDNPLEKLLEVDYLFIDELGKGRRTDFEQTIIDQLVAGRYNTNKPIIASTNCSTKETKEKDFSNLERNDFNRFPSLQEAVGERIFSRLKETCRFLALDGIDYRSRF